MPKRKVENKEDRKLRKIRKLEKKIQKYKDGIVSVTTDPEILSVSEIHQDKENELPNDPQIDPSTDELITLEVQEDHDEVEEIDINRQEDLSRDVLEALGEISPDEDNYSSEIKPNIVNILQNILTDGLLKEQREKLLKDAKVPINAKLLDAPKLNTEFLGLLNTSTRTRDNLLEERQQDLGCATGVVCQAINELAKDNCDKLLVIKKLGESVRLLVNLHFQYTQIRRKLITPFLDKSLSQNLAKNKRSEFLYSKLEESVKTTTAMKRTINVIKPKNQPKNYQGPRRPGRQIKPNSNPSFVPQQFHSKQQNPQFHSRPQNPPPPLPPRSQYNRSNRPQTLPNRGRRVNSKYP